MIRINGVDLPPPSVYRLPQYDLDSEDSGRNELGVLQRDRLRQGIFRVELEWWGINNSQLQLILSAIKPSKLTVRILSHAGYQTKQMYAGDRNIEMVRYMGKTSKMAWNISFNLVEY